MNSGDLYIIGAGFAGRMLAKEFVEKNLFQHVTAFFDDSEDLVGTLVDGVPVKGSIEDATSVLKAKASDLAVIAIPSAENSRIREIYFLLKKCGFEQIKILPSVSQIIDGDARLVQARDINPLDILGRTPVKIPLSKSLSYLRGKRVLITGAGGSIGSELARQLLSGGAERLYLFGHGENSIVNIYRELHVLQTEGIGEKASVVPIIGDMKDREYVRYIVSHTKVDVIFHCAAYKHVPMMEENPVACVENNVFGTKNLLDAALEFGTEKFVLISTDKAVAPVSVYGASKMLCEKLLLDASERTADNQNFMFVRFGNVLGSRGSILPVFMEQIKNGGPVTVTDPEMVRYFMTIPEACSLVLQTGGVGENGRSYLLDMGEPVKIVDLARQIIKFSGHVPDEDIKIKFIGVRKGERLNEPLWLAEENPVPTDYPKINCLENIREDFDLSALLEKMRCICFLDSSTPDLYRNSAALKKLLREVVPSLDEFYKSEEKKWSENTESVKVVL